MMRDFTLIQYSTLLQSLLNKGYTFIPVKEYDNNSKKRVVILRHDVDKCPINSLKVAEIERSLDIRSTFYFRAVKSSYNPNIIVKIAKLGFEIGYHYEDLTLVDSKFNVEFKKKNNLKQLCEIGIESFDHNLEKLRQIATVDTICMHGSPLSRMDSRELWKNYDYRDFQITREPYFDINMEDMLYLTDTGRRWNGSLFSIRDKYLSCEENYYSNWSVKPMIGSLMNMSKKAINFQNKFKFYSTNQIRIAGLNGILPEKIMITTHPQRWTNSPIPWINEFISQNIKNVLKFYLVRVKNFN